jgi:hypothetical protein
MPAVVLAEGKALAWDSGSQSESFLENPCGSAKTDPRGGLCCAETTPRFHLHSHVNVFGAPVQGLSCVNPSCVSLWQKETGDQAGSSGWGKGRAVPRVAGCWPRAGGLQGPKHSLHPAPWWPQGPLQPGPVGHPWPWAEWGGGALPDLHHWLACG